jgi:putative serine/threonine protein kinase
VTLLFASGILLKSQIVAIDQLMLEPYASVLCFPSPNETEVGDRIEELRGHGVVALEFSGRASVYGVPVPVLGKGFVGIVVIAHVGRSIVAIKIRRMDADRVDLFHEAQMLSNANLVGVAPKFIGVSANFLLMQLIEGDLLPYWLKANKDKNLIKQVLGEVLEDCFRLDSAGLDHGELSKAPKHIIIDIKQRPWLLDFESASMERKPSNLSAVCSFLFASSSEMSRTIAGILGKRDKEEIVKSLKEYKKSRTENNFREVLQACLS